MGNAKSTYLPTRRNTLRHSRNILVLFYETLFGLACLLASFLLYSPLLGSWGRSLLCTRKDSMPKSPAHALNWSAENHLYVLHTPDHPPQPIIPGNEEAWRAWLTTHSSFSFQGQHGRLNVLKEFRSRGTGYWYAYHTRSGRSRKRYLGTGAPLTFSRLEKVEQAHQE